MDQMPALQLETKSFEVNTYSGASKYGKNLIKVATEDGYLLEQQGWTTVHKGDSYVYMRHSSGERVKPTLKLDIPIASDLEQFAMACHAGRVAVSGLLPGNWSYRYEPARENVSRSKVMSQQKIDGQWQMVHSEKEEIRHTPSEFVIVGMAFAHPKLPPGRTMILRLRLLWDYSVRWGDGDDAPPKIWNK